MMVEVFKNARVHKTSKIIHKILNTFDNVAIIQPFALAELFFGMIMNKIRCLDLIRKNYNTEKLKDIIKENIKTFLRVILLNAS